LEHPEGGERLGGAVFRQKLLDCLDATDVGDPLVKMPGPVAGALQLVAAIEHLLAEMGCCHIPE
jgi:hypothetical protein